VADVEVKLDKPRVVVLGSGWASACFMKALPKDIKCVSLTWQQQQHLGQPGLMNVAAAGLAHGYKPVLWGCCSSTCAEGQRYVPWIGFTQQ
jgi:hypothetical protein